MSVKSNAQMRDYLQGRVAEVYIVRRGTATVVRVPEDGATWITNNLAPGTWAQVAAESYWTGSICWRGTKSDYKVLGCVPPAAESDWMHRRVEDRDLDLMGVYPPAPEASNG